MTSSLKAVSILCPKYASRNKGRVCLPKSKACRRLLDYIKTIGSKFLLRWCSVTRRWYRYHGETVASYLSLCLSSCHDLIFCIAWGVLKFDYFNP